MHFQRDTSVGSAGAWLAAVAFGVMAAACGSQVDHRAEAAMDGSTSGAGSGGSGAVASGGPGPGGSGSVSGAAGAGGPGGAGGEGRVRLHPDAEKFCNDIAAPFCGALFACCGVPLLLDWASEAECTTQVTDGCLTGFAPDVSAQIDAGATELDAGELDGCVALLESMAPGGNACTVPPYAVLMLECLDSFHGKLAIGAGCDGVPMLVCSGGYCVSGVCQAFLPSGAPCDPGGSEGYCNWSAGEWCIAGGTTGDAACGPRGDVGDPCSMEGDENPECKSSSCGDTLKCTAPTTASLCAGG